MPKCHRCAWLEHLKDFCELEVSYPNGCDAFRLKQPPLWQGVVCVAAILGLQGCSTWMNQASNADLRFLLIGLVLALVAGCWAYRVREGWR